MSQTEDVRKLAKDGYDRAGQNYLDWVLKRPADIRLNYTEKLIGFLPEAENANVLELGCGAGVPCTKALAAKCGHVVGNDISSTQIALAKDALSSMGNVEFIEGDMTLLEFPDANFDAITAFYSIIHLDPEGQIAMLKKIRKWIKPTGYLLCNLSAAEEPSSGMINEDWLGMRAYWSSFGRAGNLKMIQDHGFDIIESGTTDEVDDAPFLWIIAKPKN